MMTTIALISRDTVGHHETYLRFFTQTLLGAGCHVAAFSPQPDQIRDWAAQHCPDRHTRLIALNLAYSEKQVPGPLSIFADKLSWVRFCAQRITTSGVRPDLVFHTWLDSCVTPGLTAALTDLVMPFRWSGLYFHPWYLRQNLRLASIRRGPLSTEAALHSRRCPAVAVLDEGIADRLQARLHGKPVIVFPDPADASPPDRTFPPAIEIRARAQGRLIIGLVGALAKRKGLLTLLEVARQAAAEKWFFVFAGQLLLSSFLPEEQRLIQSWIQAPPPNCYFYPQRLPDESHFNAMIDACDILFAAYHGFPSSSNLLAKAALFEKPVIVSAGYCMGERVEKYSLGVTVPEDDAAQTLAALHQLSAQLARDGRFTTARFAEYRQVHSIEHLRIAFRQLLAAADL
jgi:glycosyltransferase involved in cell wall biosynthesis